MPAHLSFCPKHRGGCRKNLFFSNADIGNFTKFRWVLPLLIKIEELSNILNNKYHELTKAYRVYLPPYLQEWVTILKGLRGEAENTCSLQQIFSLSAAHFEVIKRNGTSALNVLCCATPAVRNSLVCLSLFASFFFYTFSSSTYYKPVHPVLLSSIIVNYVSPLPFFLSPVYYILVVFALLHYDRKLLLYSPLS